MPWARNRKRSKQDYRSEKELLSCYRCASALRRRVQGWAIQTKWLLSFSRWSVMYSKSMPSAIPPQISLIDPFTRKVASKITDRVATISVKSTGQVIGSSVPYANWCIANWVISVFFNHFNYSFEQKKTKRKLSFWLALGCTKPEGWLKAESTAYSNFTSIPDQKWTIIRPTTQQK